MFKNKQYYFISGLPRSGSTMLSAILKQNPDFYADIGSPLEGMSGGIIDHISSNEINICLDETRRKDIMYGLFDGYYYSIEKSIIFDTSRSWTKRTSFLKSLFPYSKILCPVRDLVSILNSFESISSKSPFHGKTYVESNDNVFSRCQDLMSNSGIIGKSLLYLNEGISLNRDMILLIDYERMCNNTKEVMKEVYNFIDKPYYEHDFNNLNYSNSIFDAECNLPNLHTVKSKVKYENKKIILPKEIVEKYGKMNLEFWKTDKNNSSFNYN